MPSVQYQKISKDSNCSINNDISKKNYRYYVKADQMIALYGNLTKRSHNRRILLIK